MDKTLERMNNIIVRYRKGTPLYIKPNLPEVILEIIECLKTKKNINDLIQQIKDGYGSGIHPD